MKGLVTDEATNEPLMGANIFLKGTGFGAASDFDGNYRISSIPAGSYIVKVSYIGYIVHEENITITKDRTVEINFNLKLATIEGEEVLVTAQAEAQMAAINTQLTARTIKNVVSAKQIQEIPDANAAEAVGRLPGVSLQRQGGEGQKVIIRGMSPKFNKIEISGVQMASTDNTDRSTDISMISPYMLDGIEVSKAAMPDKEADVFGGSVNFILKEAPEKFSFDALAQGSYNGLDNSFGDYKFMISGSNRFFDNKLGIFGQVDIEKRNRSAFELNVNYDNFIKLEDRTAPYDSIDGYIPSLSLKDVGREINRFGGTVILDYKLPDGKIKFYTFLSRIEKENISRTDAFAPSGNSRFLGLSQINQNLSIMVNSLRYEQKFNNLFVDAGVSFSFSENEVPNNILFRGLDKQAFGDSSSFVQDQNPMIIPNFATNDISTLNIYDINLSSSYNKSTEFSADLNLDYSLGLTKNISMLLKVGGKLKSRKKLFNNETERTPFPWDPRWNDLVVNEFFNDTYLGLNDLPYHLFLDSDINSKQYPGSDYYFDTMPNIDLVNDLANFLHDKDTSYYNYVQSKKDDYMGDEYYRAGYFMSEIKIGESITFTPGIRYEQNETTYKGIRGDESANLFYQAYEHFDTTTTRTNEYWLPMIHIKYKPVDWFDLRLAYTKTLSRPNFNQIIPSWNITDLYTTWNNPNLEPSVSENYDIYASFYENHIGLFTLGWFKKEINDFIFFAEPTGNLDSTATDLPDFAKDKPIRRWINNEFPVDLWGIEAEWQTHFWYLPGFLNGFVFNINYTHIISEAKYPRTIQESKFIPPFTTITTFTDTFYTDRLLQQPSDIINVTLGYDYSDFSIRLSFLYTDDIFSLTSFYSALQGTSESFTKWDVAIRQKLPVEGLEIFGNVNNISSSIERDIIRGKTDFPRREQHYGVTADFGVRYRF